MRVEKVSTKAVLTRSRYFIRGFMLYGVIVSIVMFATRNYTLGQALLMPLVVFGIVLYPVGKMHKQARWSILVTKENDSHYIGRSRFLKVIAKLTNDPSSARNGKKMQEQMVPLINRTYFVIMVSLFGIFITFIVSAAIFPARRDISPKGVGLNFVVIVFYIMFDAFVTQALSPIMTNLIFLHLFGWLGILGIYLYVTVLLYKTRVQIVGYPPYHEKIEAIIFLGYSQFKPEKKSLANPRYSKEFSSQDSSGVRKESYDRLRTAGERLGQVRKASIEGFQRLKVATTKKFQELSAKVKKPKQTDGNPSTLTSLESTSSEV